MRRDEMRWSNRGTFAPVGTTHSYADMLVVDGSSTTVTALRDTINRSSFSSGVADWISWCFQRAHHDIVGK